jgi:predicted Fe-Mo cluster-binding NifX family protein
MAKKIAVVTENGVNISSHFGMAPLYKVFTVEDDKIISEEERSKAYHGGHMEPHDHHHPESHNHNDMFAPIQDCDILICGGMGEPAYRKAEEVGLDVVLTGGEILPTVQSYLSGGVKSDSRRIHRH